MIEYVTALFQVRLAQLQASREGGYSTETVVITALLVALAIGVVGVIAAKVTAKAQAIPLE